MNMGKEFIALTVKMAIGGFAGDVCAALIKALWPPKVTKEKRMMEIIMEWTKNYVDAQFEIELRSHVSALIETGTKDMLDMYHSCIEKVKEDAKRAWFFPKTDFIACLGHLTNAIEPTTQALYEVANSKWKGGNVPTFLMAATVVMSLWREYYAEMVFQENWKRWPGAEPPKNASEALNVTYTYTSKEIIQRMEAKYAWIQDHTKKVAEAWRPWRFEKIHYSYKQLSENAWRDSIEVRDYLRSKTQYWKSERCCLIANPNYKKLQPRVQAMYEQNLVALELMPMLKPVATLHRLIPKRENENPALGEGLPLGNHRGYCVHLADSELDPPHRHSGSLVHRRQKASRQLWLHHKDLQPCWHHPRPVDYRIRPLQRKSGAASGFHGRPRSGRKESSLVHMWHRSQL